MKKNESEFACRASVEGAPEEVGAAGEVATVEVVLGVGGFAGLRRRWDAWVEAEPLRGPADGVAGEEPEAVDVPGDPPGKPASGVHADGEVCVVERCAHGVGVGVPRHRRCQAGAEEVSVIPEVGHALSVPQSTRVAWWGGRERAACW